MKRPQAEEMARKVVALAKSWEVEAALHPVMFSPDQCFKAAVEVFLRIETTAGAVFYDEATRSSYDKT